MRTILILVLSIALAGASPTLAGAASEQCGSTQHSGLDFWLGDWDVANAKGVASGTSRVERILGGCVVMENWTSVRGGYEGKSFNTFDPATGQWTQHWVDNGGLSAVMVGEFHEKALVYRRSFAGKDGVATTTRMTFVSLDAGKVRQLVEQSVDGGKTWATQYDLRYTRRAAK